MRNEEVVEVFLNRRIASTANLTSTGDRLISYNTCIAQWVGSKLLINNTKYSVTTSRHLGYLRKKTECVNIVNNIERGTLWLTR